MAGNGIIAPFMTTDTMLLIAIPVGSYLLWRNGGLIVHLLYKAVAGSGMSKYGRNYLEGNFAPIKEETGPVAALKVESGTIPTELDGVFVRTGPNPMFTPLGGYHWFDGDGMLHAVRLHDGVASYCSRYVDTSRLRQEKAKGEAVFLKLGDLVGLRGILLGELDKWRKYFKFFDLSHGAGTANTALVYHARRLLALHEGDMPYAIKLLCNGVIETLGRMSRLAGPGDEYRASTFTAHPKVCGATGELLFFGYQFQRPYVSAGIMDTHGLLKRTWDVDVPYPAMMHDMAATRTYLVLLHMPLTFDGSAMGRGLMPLQFDKTKTARIGLLRRDQPSTAAGAYAAVQWFEFPAFYVFHVVNAWEDPDTGKVRIFACHFEEFSFESMMDSHEMRPGQRQRLQEYTLDPATGEGTMHQASSVCGDFPVVHPKSSGLPHRYAWLATFGSTQPVNFTGLAKVDLLTPKGKDALIASLQFSPGCIGGEATFVPRHPNPSTADQEDDGWLLVYVWHATHAPAVNGSAANGSAANGKHSVHSTENGVSKLHIYDAKSMDAAPLAVIALPRRVPFGFHGTFVTDAQVKAQLNWI